MSTSDQEQAVDAAPEARGAGGAAEGAVPKQGTNPPTAKGASRTQGAETAADAGSAAGTAEDATDTGAGPAPETANSFETAPAEPAEPVEPAGHADAAPAAEPAKPVERTGHVGGAAGAEPAEPVEPAGHVGGAAGAEPAEPADEGERRGMAPRQARRVRMVAAGVLMAAMGVILVVRLATRSSVLVVGVYGLALILCGVVIELSRNGRTRLGSWLLVVGLAAALGMDWFVLP
ncbi:hypothetical protein ACFYZ9_04895 [Streptomyces sp. NPDC001691]|uniref:hypothetical protein n=1 Tax=Streptomyces sp. NPDC001691 TaxID=3364600 RepID=UPI0036BB7BDC